MEYITSSQNQRFKMALRLHQSRGRKKQNSIIVFGVREITRAIQAGVTFREFVWDDSMLDSEPIEKLRDKLQMDDIEEFGLNSSLFAKLAYGDRTDGAIGIANRPDTKLDSLTDRMATNNDSAAMVVVLESLEKPGNLGAICRSADGAGADAVLISDALTDPFHPNAIRSSVATVFSIPMAIDSSANVQHWLREQEYQILIATPESSESIYDVDMQGKIAIVFGNEANGLTESWRDTEHRKAGNWIGVKLPMVGIADSLNVSVSASLMMYEARRQRDKNRPK